MDRLTTATRDPKVLMQCATIVVIAGHHVERRPQRCEKLSDLVVFRMVRQVAGDEDRVRLTPHGTDRMDRRVHACHGIDRPAPRRTDVQITELDDQERTVHGPIIRWDSLAAPDVPTALHCALSSGYEDLVDKRPHRLGTASRGESQTSLEAKLVSLWILHDHPVAIRLPLGLIIDAQDLCSLLY